VARKPSAVTFVAAVVETGLKHVGGPTSSIHPQDVSPSPARRQADKLTAVGEPYSSGEVVDHGAAGQIARAKSAADALSQATCAIERRREDDDLRATIGERCVNRQRLGQEGLPGAPRGGDGREESVGGGGFELVGPGPAAEDSAGEGGLSADQPLLLSWPILDRVTTRLQRRGLPTVRSRRR
jgi:hypothetical protein